MSRGTKPPRWGWRSGAAAASVLGLAIAWTSGLAPAPIFAVYVAMSAGSLVLYRGDKRAAQGGTTRTRERTLHVVDLLGGWPGGLLAQERLKHKTRKTRFQVVFWATVALNCVALGWLLVSGVGSGGVM